MCHTEECAQARGLPKFTTLSVTSLILARWGRQPAKAGYRRERVHACCACVAPCVAAVSVIQPTGVDTPEARKH